MERLVVIGAGGFGREVLDIVEAINADYPQLEFLGFLDDGIVDTTLLKARGVALVGGVDRLNELSAAYVIGIGVGPTRERIDRLPAVAGCRAATVVHPSASLGALVELGPGAVIAAGARLTNNITLGRHVHVNINATIGHDCVLGDYVTVNPGVNVSGSVTVGNKCTLGTGASIIQGISIGAETTVGAGAVVVSDLPAGVVAVGVPARPREDRSS